MAKRQKHSQLVAVTAPLDFEPRNPDAAVSSRAAWNLRNKSGGIKAEYKVLPGNDPRWIGPATKEEPKLGPANYTDAFISNQCALTDETMASVNREGFGAAFAAVWENDITEVCGIKEVKAAAPTKAKRGRGRPKGSKGKAVEVTGIEGLSTQELIKALSKLLAG